MKCSFKRLSLTVALSIALMGGVGCHVTTSTPPVAPSYVNSTDQSMGEVLAAAHAFYSRIQNESAQNEITLTAGEKTALNALGTAINTAQVLYLGYHTNPTANNQQQAAAAISQVQAAQANVQNQGVK